MRGSSMGSRRGGKQLTPPRPQAILVLALALSRPKGLLVQPKPLGVSGLAEPAAPLWSSYAFRFGLARNCRLDFIERILFKL